ncbi:MAG: hypothetical protein K6B13_13160 [Prevotella sp.]|nr:hypothetical protein [Prevotella sp.]
MEKLKIVIILIIGLLLASCYEEDQEVSYDYCNGQTMTIVPSLRSQVDSVVYYLDEQWIDTQREMPFVLVYPILSLSSGTHVLKYWVYYTPGSYLLDDGRYVIRASNTQYLEIQ